MQFSRSINVLISLHTDVAVSSRGGMQFSRSFAAVSDSSGGTQEDTCDRITRHARGQLRQDRRHARARTTRNNQRATINAHLWRHIPTNTQERTHTNPHQPTHMRKLTCKIAWAMTRALEQKHRYVGLFGPLVMLLCLYYTILYYTILYSTLLYSTLLYSTLLYSTLLYSTLLYSTLLYSTLLYSTLLYSTLLYSTLLYSTLLYSTLLYSTLLYSTLLYSTLLYSTLLYSTILYYTILYYTILYYTILYYTILYYTILHYTILYYIIFYDSMLYYTTLY